MCLISANGMNLNNFPSHYLGLILKQNAIIFFFMLPSLIAFFCTDCFSISLLSKGQLELSLFLTDCITTSTEFRNIWNAQPTRPDLEPKPHTWTPCKSAFHRFSFFSFGLLIEKHSNTILPWNLSGGWIFFFFFKSTPGKYQASAVNAGIKDYGVWTVTTVHKAFWELCGWEGLRTRFGTSCLMCI